jgi:hypothetical protein
MYIFFLKLDRLLTTLFNNNTKKLLDNSSAESSTNSSGFHSKSTTTLFNNELNEITFSSKKKMIQIKKYFITFRIFQVYLHCIQINKKSMCDRFVRQFDFSIK